MTPRQELYSQENLERRDLETRLWLLLLSLKNNIFSSLNSALNKELGLSVAKFEVLVQLDRYPEGLSLGKLSTILKVTSGNISTLVARLLQDDLIVKEMSTADRRSFIVRLSEKGKDVFAKASVVHDQRLMECLRSASDEGLGICVENLRTLYKHVGGK